MRVVLMAMAAALAAGPACSQATGNPGPGAALPTTVDAAYREALRLSPLPRDVEAEQAEWRASRAGAGQDGAEETYHLERLQRRIAADRRARALRVQPADMEKGCLQIELLGCGAPAGGFLKLADDHVLYWQTQDGHTEEDGVGGGVVVVERKGGAGALTPLVWTAEGSAYEAPLLIFAGDGEWLLVLPGVSRGTGAGDMMRMLRYRNGAWRQIDTDWQARAGALLNGREVRHRPYWSFHDGMRAITPLWNASDAQCCGEAGTALLEFEIVDDRLTLGEVRMLGGGR